MCLQCALRGTAGTLQFDLGRQKVCRQEEAEPAAGEDQCHPSACNRRRSTAAVS